MMGEPRDTYCLIPDCDEQPYPGEELCYTHLQEELAWELSEQRIGKQAMKDLYNSDIPKGKTS